jgi:hypothetical protein
MLQFWDADREVTTDAVRMQVNAAQVPSQQESLVAAFMLVSLRVYIQTWSTTLQ